MQIVKPVCQEVLYQNNLVKITNTEMFRGLDFCHIPLFIFLSLLIKPSNADLLSNYAKQI